MKNIKLSMIALIAIGNIAYAGGDIAPVTYYETHDAVDASIAYEEEVIEPIYQEPIPEPVYLDSEPIIESEPIVEEIVPKAEPKPAPVVVQPKPVVVKQPVPIPVSTPKSISPSGFYAGLGITGSRYQSNCNCPDSSNGSSNLGSPSKSQRSGKENNVAALVRVGYDFNRYVGIEARGIGTLDSGSSAKISHMGLFVKPMIPITDSLNTYGLVGLAKTKVTGSYQNVDAESLALGGGFELDLSTDTPKEGRYSRNFDGQGDQEKGMGLFVDYERLVAKQNSPDLDTVSAGVTYDF